MLDFFRNRFDPHNRELQYSLSSPCFDFNLNCYSLCPTKNFSLGFIDCVFFSSLTSDFYNFDQISQHETFIFRFSTKNIFKISTFHVV
jgi:hypothetical protein